MVQILWPPCTASIAPRIREDPFFHSKFLNGVCYKKTSSAIPRERLGIFFLKTRSLLGELNMWIVGNQKFLQFISKIINNVFLCL